MPAESNGGRPPFDSAGITYARVSVLRTAPTTHTPPTEESEVYLASPEEARQGYGVDTTERPLDVGLLRNGGTAFAGRATLDLDYLLGENGGHLNVNGIAGLGAKSSFLLHVNALLLHEAARQKVKHPGKPKRGRKHRSGCGTSCGAGGSPILRRCSSPFSSRHCLGSSPSHPPPLRG